MGERSRSTAVGIPTVYGLRGQEICPFSKTSRPTLGSAQPTVQGTGFFFPGIKRQGCEVYHSASSSAELNNEWSCTSIPPIFLHRVDMANFVLKEQEESDCELVKCQRFLDLIKKIITVTWIIIALSSEIGTL
jgi:hypothetical protein